MRLCRVFVRLTGTDSGELIEAISSPKACVYVPQTKLFIFCNFWSYGFDVLKHVRLWLILRYFILLYLWSSCLWESLRHPFVYLNLCCLNLKVDLICFDVLIVEFDIILLCPLLYTLMHLLINLFDGSHCSWVECGRMWCCCSPNVVVSFWMIPFSTHLCFVSWCWKRSMVFPAGDKPRFSQWGTHSWSRFVPYQNQEPACYHCQSKSIHNFKQIWRNANENRL